MKTKITSLLTLVLVFMMQVSFAQKATKTVTGTVADENGQPLVGASVIVNGTKTGTNTDKSGKFSIAAADGQSLTFSFVGYNKSTVAVTSATSSVQVSLTSDNTLDEVIVTSYSTSTKQSFTGTAKVVDAKNIERKNFSNISKGLAGEAAGVTVINSSGQPGTSAAIRIRGIGTVNGSRGPLYVLDGVPFEGNINSINPGDIENTTILKDAAATAIYGSRGANGVVVINTKRGSKTGDAVIELELKSGQNMSLLPRYSTIRNPEQYIGLTWEGWYNRGVALANANPTAYANTNLFANMPNYNMWTVPAAQLIDPTTRQVVPGSARRYNPENWADFAFQNSNRNEANLKISGGNSKTRYFASYGALEDVGYSVNTDYKRYSTRLNLTHNPKSWLSSTTNIGYSYGVTNNPGQTSDSGSVFWFVDNLPPIYPLFLHDNTTSQYVRDPYYNGYQYDYGVGRGFGALTNSIADAKLSIRNTKSHDINAATSLNIQITPSLSLENKLGLQYSNASLDNQNNPFYGPNAGQGGYIYKQKTENLNYNLLNLLRYKKSFDVHNFEAFVAHESYATETKFMWASMFKLVMPDGVEFNNAVISNPPQSYLNNYSLESYFGQLNYDYDGKYFLSATVRRDGSSRFLKNKWGDFGSVGAAWLVSKEAFMDNVPVIKDLKLKASYGLIGEQGGIGLYPGYDLFQVQNLNSNISLSFVSKGNPDLTWEISKQMQVGAEFKLGKYLDVAIDYYTKTTDNLIFDRRVGPSVGYASLRVNDGALRNTGLEFDITAHLLQSKKNYLDFTINGEMIENRMLRLPIDPATGKEKIIDIDGIYGRAVGHSIFDFYTREFAGVNPETGVSEWNVYWADANGDNVRQATENIKSMADFEATATAETLKTVKVSRTATYADGTTKFINKSPFPTVRGAFTLNGGLGNFDISAQFLYSLGGYAYDGAYAGLMNSGGAAGGNNYHTDILARWTKAGMATDVPRLSAGQDANVNSASTRFITKSDFLTLNNIQIGYKVPSKFFTNSPITGVYLWVSGDNLFLASARNGFNPSSAETGSSDQYRYSPLSTMTAGLRVKF